MLPRTRWMAPEQWARLKQGEDCGLRADIHLEVNQFSFLVAELEWSYVRLARNQYRPGWTLVALKRHACELFELTDHYWSPLLELFVSDEDRERWGQQIHDVLAAELSV